MILFYAVSQLKMNAKIKQILVKGGYCVGVMHLLKLHHQFVKTQV